MLEVTFNHLRLHWSEAFFPLLTQWYQLLGADGLLGIAALPGLLALILLPFRSQLLATGILGLALIGGLYVTAGAMVALHIAYVKFCISL
ncbi:hypothetical protein G3480_25605 [Thiorhodococcus mannitoliphagus]|uniref:Uncharacterized protein n=1 Tax=Thiorhodococcus mannitoliphagus TaxID=329406 RepID=A0A6P1E1D9_9GAMM|nr:hypothetical protein [Thiorhodococcus mannitoliphagus]NEX23610.1 hypothetical protein [Thiorhodococcus mannitoliphagus]